MILSRWAVAFDARSTDGPVETQFEAWFARARAEYLADCPIPDGTDATASAPVFELRGEPGESDLLVATSTTEVFDTSFRMSCRARALGEGGAVIAEGSCSVTLVDAVTGETVPLTGDVRAYLIAKEQGAAFYC